MQNSSRKINKNIEKQIFVVLHQMIMDLKSGEEVELVMTDLLSSGEHGFLAKRLAIAVFLDKGRSYENIMETLKVSSATVASVSEMMGNPGVVMALRKVKAEEWAESWAKRLRGLVK